jgi:hypothetical protein
VLNLGGGFRPPATGRGFRPPATGLRSGGCAPLRREGGSAPLRRVYVRGVPPPCDGMLIIIIIKNCYYCGVLLFLGQLTFYAYVFRVFANVCSVYFPFVFAF